MLKSPTEAVINFLSKHRCFTLCDVVETSGLDRSKLLRVLEKFRKEGFLNIIDEIKYRPANGEYGPCRRNPQYKRIKDISQRPKKQRPECERDKIWRTLRHLRKATRSDLIRLTGCNENTISVYTRKLVIHGYLKEFGRRGREKIFILIKNEGPKRPIIPGE